MFWLSVVTTFLSYFSTLNILQRLKERYPDTLVCFKGNDPQGAVLVYHIINSATGCVAMLAVAMFTMGLFPDDFFYYQYWVIGYLWYQILATNLYPELLYSNTTSWRDHTISIVMCIGAYVYSFGAYSRLYSWVMLLSMEDMYHLWTLFRAPIKKEPEQDYYLWIKSRLPKARLGLLAFLTFYSTLSLNLFPMIFFGGLLGMYSGLISI
jgi:hypothetical protein